MRRYHIAVVAFSGFGGSSIVGFQKARRLAERGHDVCFLSSEPARWAGEARENLTILGVRDVCHPEFGPEAYSVVLAESLLDIHRSTPLDVIHAHYAIPHAISLALVRQIVPEPKLVTTLHGTDVTIYTSCPSLCSLTRWSLGVCDAVVVPSLALQRAAVSRFNVGAQRFQVIGNFVDLKAFKPAPSAAIPYLIHVSNLRSVKRGLDVIEVFRRCRDRITDLKLMVVGDGPDRVKMQHRCRELKLDGDTAFLGLDDDVSGHLRKASIFVLPSETESFGLAALEALACGVPVVGSRVGGLPEVVEHGSGGYLYPVGDVGAMADACLALLLDNGLYETQRRLARSRAEVIGDPEPIIDTYEKLYMSLNNSL